MGGGVCVYFTAWQEKKPLDLEVSSCLSGQEAACCRVKTDWKELLSAAFVMRASPSFIILFSTAISWSAVPEQPLDVTSDGFRQGTTKKRIGSLQSRYANVVMSEWRYLICELPLSAYVMWNGLSQQRDNQWEKMGKVERGGKGKSLCEGEKSSYSDKSWMRVNNCVLFICCCCLKRAW